MSSGTDATRTRSDPQVEGTGAPRTWRGRLTERQRMLGYRLLGYALVLGAWQWTSTNLISSRVMPTLGDLVDSTVEVLRSGMVLEQFGQTLLRAGISLVVLYVLGAGIGILMGLSRWWEAFFRVWITTVTNLPGLVIVLLVLAVFGLNPLGPYVAIVLVVFGFVTLQVWEGVRALPEDLMAMGHAFGVSRARMLRQVVIPALAPFLFTALTYGFTLTWKITMLTELFGSSSGVGYMFRLTFSQYDIPGMLAWAILSYAFFVFIERAVLQRLSSRFFRWRVGAYD